MSDDTRISRSANPAGTGLSRRKVLIGLGMAAASGAAFARMPVPNRPPVKKETFESLIPDTVGPWRFATESGVVLPPPDALSDRLYDNLVTRVYSDSASRGIMFLVAYNNRQDGVLQIHRPEICYPAGGFALTPTVADTVPLSGGRMLPAKSFIASGSDRDEAVLYWTRVGDEFPVRWSDQRLAVIKANLQGVIPDGLLFRVSILGSDMKAELPIMKRFVSEFIEAAPAPLRAVLLGSARL